MVEQLLREFSVTVYGGLTKYSDTISKARCRIFYKYANRNGTYITDEFAEKLLSTIPYTPVKGIYDNFNEDYTDHGKAREQGRIYGIVPENPNLQWEKHLDEDGVEREYACVDVLIFTGLYEEAEGIVGKGQSMEIYEPSIKGSWQIVNSRRMFVYTDGCFLGLQVLGDEVEPCFEGAAFFSLYSSLKQMIDEIKEYTVKLPELDKGGQIKMPEILNFKLSDSQKHDKIWSQLNPNYNEENNWAIDCVVTEVFDEYALVYNYENNNYSRVYYTKNDETNEVTLGEQTQVFIVDLTEEELGALNRLREVNSDFNAIYEVYSSVEGLNAQIETLKTENENFSLKVEELTNNYATLETEKTELFSKLEEAQNSIQSLQEENESLKNFKAAVELKEKEAIIDSYSKLLNEETLNSFKEKISEYTAIELDKEMAYSLKQSNFTVFTSTQPQPSYIPKDNSTPTGIEAILAKYKK